VLRVNDEIPRRPAPDAGSLIDVDACTLLTATDLDALPGFTDPAPDSGFANWDCRWSTADGSAAARVIFDRGSEESAREGIHSTRAGHDVYIEEEGYGANTCSAEVLNREYRNSSGDDIAEMALVVIEGDPPMADMCQMADALADPVASRLP